MSASLVGSEMCIRDSQATGRPPITADAAPRSSWICSARARPARCGLHYSVLLYTSDAADDM
eukprot:2091392-Alexandrium_andersonii.AAC.1